MKFLYIILCFLGSFCYAKAQESMLKINGRLQENAQISLNNYLLIPNNNEDSLKAITAIENGNFTKLSANKNVRIGKKLCFLYLFIENTHSTDTLKAIARIGQFVSTNFYIQIIPKDSTFLKNTTPFSSIKNGLLQNFEQSLVKPTIKVDGKFGIPLVIPPNSKAKCCIKIMEIVASVPVKANLFSEKGYQHYLHKTLADRKPLFMVLFIVMGVCAFLAISAIIQFIYLIDYTYLCWALYLLSNFVLFTVFAENILELNIISSKTLAFIYVPVHYTTVLTYLIFLSSFLRIKNFTYKLWYFILLMMLIVLGIIGCYFLADNKIEYHHLLNYFELVAFVEYAIFIIFIALFFSKIPQRELLLIGSVVVLFTAIVAALMDEINISNFDDIAHNSEAIYGFGVLFELLCFSLALSQRAKLMERKGKKLQENYTKRLEEELHERIQIIEKQNSQIEEQRILNLTNDFQQRIAETEVTALRSQMNPHFIFNCLNSIKLYSLENDSEAASDYLTKFSRLMRLVLENSRSEKVTLENELETLRLYIEMEAMRFKHKVKYEIKVAAAIDQQFTEIPPLIIQPFVENAIWHGLMHKEEGGFVHIHVSQEEEILKIEIIDDGIGREKSALYKSKSATRNKPFGMKITSDRIKLINQIYKINTQVRIIDLKNEFNEPIGTKVIIEIPV